MNHINYQQMKKHKNKINVFFHFMHVILKIHYISMFRKICLIGIISLFSTVYTILYNIFQN